MENMSGMLGLTTKTARDALEGKVVGKVRVSGGKDRQYLEYPTDGLCLVTDWGTVTGVKLYKDKLDGYKGYKGAIPGGGTFGMSKEDLQAIYGEPVGALAEFEDPLIGVILASNHFDFEDLTIHVEYQSGKAVRFSLMQRQDSPAVS